MGNFISSQPSNIAGKLILLDGTIHHFDKPLPAAELMLDYPNQVVVEFRSAVTGKRPTPLPADKMLDMKKVYLMIPMKRGKPAALTSEEARRILLSANSVLQSRSFLWASRIFPMFAKIRPAGAGREEVVEKPAEVYVPEFIPEIVDGRNEYLSRQFSGKGWKPSLDTIKETKVEKKVTHWMF